MSNRNGSTGSGGDSSLSRDSVLDWFSHRLLPHERLELLCPLLLSCAPTELRFLSNWSEAAAAASAGAIELREAEARTNSPDELVRLAECDTETALCRLTLALALVKPDNATCGRLLASWLERLDLERCASPRHACLIGALALHQPALPFACRLRLLPIHCRLKSRLAAEDSAESATAASAECHQSGPSVDSSVQRARSHSASGAGAPQSRLSPLPPHTAPASPASCLRQRRLSDAILDCGPKQRTAAAGGQCLRHAALTSAPVRRGEDEASCNSVGLETVFCIQVALWPGRGAASEIVRSLSDLLTFYAKVQSVLKRHSGSISLLESLLIQGRPPAGLSGHVVNEAVRLLLRAISNLPEAARRSADILDFFSLSRRPPRPPPPAPQTSAASAAAAAAAAVNSVHGRARSDSGLTGGKSGLMLQFQSLTIASAGYPADCAVYAACHYGQDYQSKLLTWLKTHRMHKYFDRLRKYSFEQLLAIDRPTLEALEFTQGAIKKLLGMVERVRQDRQAFECPSRSSGSPCSSGACSEEELQLHGMLRSPPRQMHYPPQQQQQQQFLRKPHMAHPQQHRMLGPLPMPMPTSLPPPPPHLQHLQSLQQLHHHQQQQRQPLSYSASNTGGCGSPA